MINNFEISVNKIISNSVEYEILCWSSSNDCFPLVQAGQKTRSLENICSAEELKFRLNGAEILGG